MIDFSSSLYLGMKHSSAELNGWPQLTTGVPAVLYEPTATNLAGSTVAAMQGLEKGICVPSTVHAYTDLYGLLCKNKISLFIDAKIYPVSLYGIEKLLVSGIQVVPFRHQDAAHLQWLVKKKARAGALPVVMSDGWCTVCGKPAPVKDYARIVQSAGGGNIIIDDTQAFGILGEGRNKNTPYGQGGGGLLKWLQFADESIVTITSLAKAFGAPLAVVSGSSQLMAAFEKESETRTSSSPASMAHTQAALNALRINQPHGDARRERLWKNVKLLRACLREKNITAGGGIFPVQHVACASANMTMLRHKQLRDQGIRTVLTSLHNGQPAITVVVRSDHTVAEIKALAASLTSQFNLYGNFTG